MLPIALLRVPRQFRPILLCLFPMLKIFTSSQSALIIYFVVEFLKYILVNLLRLRKSRLDMTDQVTCAFWLAQKKKY